jgi:hypothetical protein
MNSESRHAQHVTPSDERPSILAHMPSQFSTLEESNPQLSGQPSAPEGHVLSVICLILSAEQHSTSVTCRGYCACLV